MFKGWAHGPMRGSIVAAGAIVGMSAMNSLAQDADQAVGVESTDSTTIGTPGSGMDPIPLDPSENWMGPLTVCFNEIGMPSADEIAELHERLINAGRMFIDDNPLNHKVDLDGHVGPALYQIGNGWNSVGIPFQLRWSFVPDGLNIPNGIGEGAGPSVLFSTLDSQFGGNRATWILQFQRSFDRWAEISGLSYVRITFGGNDWDDGASWNTGGSSARGDVRIGMKPISPSGILAYNAFPPNGNMVLNSNVGWSSSTNQYRFLRNVIMHEHGHGMGIGHVCSTGSMGAAFLMAPALNTSFDGPRHDDIRAAHRLYGSAFEIDNSPATANELGVLPPGVTGDVCALPLPITGSNPGITPSCSIYGTGDEDWWRFSLANASTVSIEVIPRGFEYADNAQAANGSCPTGNFTNSLDRANLELDLYASDGTTLINQSVGGLRGENELIEDQALAAGTYYARVYHIFTPNQSQLYRMVFTVTEGVDCLGDLDNDGVIGLGDLVIVLSDFGCSGGGCAGDVDGDGDTGLGDLLIILGNFGSCG